MCGRFTVTSPAEILARDFGFEPPSSFAPRYNICPGQAIGVVRPGETEGLRELAFLHWGLVPHWMKERPRDARMINARSETVADKPSFRDSFRKRRCLVPADGFFEWKAGPGGKQPYLIRMRSGAPFAIAGIWAQWTGGEGDPLESCALLTTTPNELMAPIHDRMPVLLGQENWDAWLDTAGADPQRLQEMLVPAPADAMEAIAVSRWVNSPRNDDPRCLEPHPRETLFDS
jgi:putative SOS response-associated peptidase YedK